MDHAVPHEQWNDRSDPATTATIPQLFFRAVDDRKDALALVDGEHRLTYGELSVKVAQLAHRLRRSGVATEGVVGICMPRSAEMVIAILASVVAGGAFVPVDPEWPEARRRQVLHDASVRVALTAPGAASSEQVDSFDVSLQDWRFGDGPSEPPQPPISGSQLAYVIFTSGSTGAPKGAMIRHEAICERLVWQRDVVLGFGTGDAALFKAPLAFDISINEILLPLISGGKVVVAPAGSEKDPDQLLDLIAAEQVTFVYLVSSMLDAMLALDRGRAEQGEAALTGVTHIWCGGEVLTPSLFERFRRQLSTTLYHGYGPAEATIGVSHVIYRDSAERIATSIGRPNPHTQLYVLDETLTPVPAGVGGELYAAGFLLGRGYVGSPTLTASAFVANPFDVDGSRMYRTGDLARWNDDGTLEFLGRADNQVKIGGRRVELEEIDASIARHPTVRQAVVTIRKSRSGSDALAAYVTLPAGVAIDIAELRSWCDGQLPDYMVPATFTVLERLPLTANGKVDRRALPDPAMPEPAAIPAAAGTADEAVVCDAFARVLGVEQVGVNDDFFALGGDSIVAVQLVLALRAAGYTARAKDIALHRSPAQLAAALNSDPTPDADAVDPSIALIELDDAEASELAAAVPGLRKTLPLTTVQAGICFLSMSVPAGGQDPYIVQQVVDLDGPLDVARLRQATHAVVERHDALAAGFHVTRAGRLVSTVGTAAPPDFRVLRWDDTNTQTSETFVDDIARQDRERGFDLTRPPLMRYTLIRLGEDRHRLVQTVHHIIADGWSVALIWNDILTAYRGDPFSSLAPQLDGFLRWWVHSRDRERDLPAWAEYLAGVDEPTLIADHVPGSSGVTGYGRRRRALADEQRQALKRYARAHSVSEGAVLTAAWGLTVGTALARTDVVFGSTAAGRGEDVDGLERIVGMLLNTVATRVRWSSGDTLDMIVQRFADGEASVLDHQHVPLTDVQAAIGVGELFDSLFSIENLQRPQDGGDLRLGSIEYIQAPHYHLTAMVTLHESVSVAVTNDRGAIVDTLADRIAETYLRVVNLIVDAPASDGASAGGRAQRDLSELWVPADTRAGNSTASWAVGDTFPPSELTVDALMRARAAAPPDAIALIDGESGASQTFAQFDARVNAFACSVIDAGVQVGDRVAVLLPRSTDLVVVLAGILRAGAAYVPIDPAYPTQRVAHILADAAPSLVVTDIETERAHAAALTAEGVLRLDDGVLQAMRARADVPAVALPRALHPADAACVIFTSGTTGRPKGVELSHGALVNRLTWGRQHLGWGPLDVGLVKSGLGFVDAATELFGPLISGSRVVVVPEGIARDPDALAAAVQRHGVTHLLTVPSLADAVAGVPDAAIALRSLRAWVASGEVLTPQTAQAMAVAAPGAVLRNFYGSTEITGDGTAITVPAGRDPIERVTIGSPVANTVARVLDDWLRPVPPGVIGELYIGGAQLADGYAGRPALTADRFVADPFGTSGERLYRTGDLVRWDDTGSLEYVGRSDDQLKIRGMRIELEEIRAVVAQHPAVADATVIAVEHPSSGASLAAYIVAPDAGDDTDLEQSLLTHASALLPDYMVPTFVVRVDAFPLTANGKLDRRALPEPDCTRREGPRGRLPETDAEIALAGVFREVLHLADDTGLGIDDDFFRLGGDSILSIRVVRLARQRGLDLTIHDVFALRTPGRLAEGRVVDRADVDSPGADSPGAPQAAGAIAVPPPVTQHRLRLSGIPIEDCIYTEVIELRQLPTTPQLEAAVASLLRDDDWLRQRVTPSHRLLWTTDVNPFTAERAALSASVHTLADLAVDDAVRRLRSLAVERIDITAGTAFHVAVAGTAEGVHLVAAVHGLAADRPRLHQLAEHLAHVIDGDDHIPDAAATSIADVSTSLSDIAHAPQSETTLTDWVDRLLTLPTGAGNADATDQQGGPASPTGFTTHSITADYPADDDAAVVGAVESAFLAAVAKSAYAGRTIDLEWDLRSHLATSEDPTVADPAAPGALTAVYPRLAGEPVPAYAPWYDLWRYLNKTSRKALRRAPQSEILLTRVYGRQPALERLEGFESRYHVVARYTITREGVDLQVHGPESAMQLRDLWADAIDARHLAFAAQK